MTIHIARRRNGQDWRVSLDVYLDGEKVASLGRGMSVNVQGNGRVQQLQVRCWAAGDSAPLAVTDPGDDVVGVVVSYRAWRGLFSRTKAPLSAEINWIDGAPVTKRIP